MSYITPGLTYSWVNDGQVLVYKATSVSAHIMIEWAQHILETLSRWSDSKPIQIMFDLSSPRVSIPYMILTNKDIFNIGITDLGRVKVQQMLLQRGNLFGRLAVLLPSSSSGMMVKANSRSSTPAVESRVFTDYSTAIEWVADVKTIAQKFSQTRSLDVKPDLILAYTMEQSNSSVKAEKKLGLFYNQEHLLIEIPSDEQIIVGRQDFETDMIGAAAYTVSRLHAQFLYIDTNLYLVDLQSTNGTFLNGARIQPRINMRLKVEDEIRFGSVGVRLSYVES